MHWKDVFKFKHVLKASLMGGASGAGGGGGRGPVVRLTEEEVRSKILLLYLL